MELSHGLILKCVGGLGAVSLGSAGVYFLNDYSQSALTRFDRGLIEYLEKDGNDIVFTLKNGTQDLGDSFPTSFTNNDLDITVEVSATTQGDTNLKGTNNDAAKKKLQSLNGGKDNTGGTAWTWVCEMKFSRDSESSTVNDINDIEKDRIFKPQNDGLLGKLKKNVSPSSVDATERQKIKDIKRSFIEKCALARTRTKNKEIDGQKSLPASGDDANKVITLADDIEFKLEKGKTTSDASKLFFENKDRFNYWFPE